MQQERGGSMALQYRISRGMPGAGSTGACPARMERFAFAPVETQHGSFRMAVDYASASTVTVLKDSTSHAPMAQVLLPKTCTAVRHPLKGCKCEPAHVTLRGLALPKHVCHEAMCLCRGAASVLYLWCSGSAGGQLSWARATRVLMKCCEQSYRKRAQGHCLTSEVHTLPRRC